jgi:hypothetical protein
MGMQAVKRSAHSAVGVAEFGTVVPAPRARLGQISPAMADAHLADALAGN